MAACSAILLIGRCTRMQFSVLSARSTIIDLVSSLFTSFCQL
jgi:hypothetical protein